MTDLIFSKAYLTPSLATAPEDFCDALKEAGANLFHGRFVTDDFCDAVMARVRDYEDTSSDGPIYAANSMHHNALTASHLGLERAVQDLANCLLEKLGPHTLPNRLRLKPDSIHAYVVRYGPAFDHDLGFHVDDSYLTLNLCLNDGFEGSELVFEGERCPMHVDSPSKAGERVTIQHKKGWMVVHPGKNRHFVQSIAQGDRYNFIIWCQSDAERAAWFGAERTYTCTEFCGYQTP